MTREEAIKMLKAKLKCMERTTSGMDMDCNNDNCDNCDLCYLQGTNGEQKEALKIAIEALKKQISKKTVLTKSSDGIITYYPCPNCSTAERYIPVYPKVKYCVNCGQKLDWSDNV